jgi:hypothetical protein
MNPDETWVILNKINLGILFVYPEKFMAENKHKKLCSPGGPITGTESNSSKLVVCTLSRAIAQIAYEYCGTME